MKDEISFNELLKSITQIDPGGSLCLDVAMCRLSTMRVGGPAMAVYTPSNQAALCTAVSMAAQMGVPYHVLGGGSNTVPGDDPYSGLIFLTKALNRIKINGIKIAAECGCPINSMIISALHGSLGGLESLYGIPGTVGGAVRMNAGAHGCEIADLLESATLFSPHNGQVFCLDNRELRFAYRDSLLQHRQDLLLLDATFICQAAAREDIQSRIRTVVKSRCQSQPLDLPSVGSVFRRPSSCQPVWQLIDACGLRGYQIGGAQISEKHAGFIVNRDNAKAADICALLSLCRRRVYERFQVTLMPEIEFFHLNEEEKCHLQES